MLSGNGLHFIFIHGLPVIQIKCMLPHRIPMKAAEAIKGRVAKRLFKNVERHALSLSGAYN
jgi:hypothetical protein